jgi:sortase A
MSIDRRRFLVLALGLPALLATGCRTAAARAEPAPTILPTPAASLPFPAKPTPRPTATPVPTVFARPGGATAPAHLVPYATRTLPPDRLRIPAIDLDSKIVPIATRLDQNGRIVWETAAFAVGFHQGSANLSDPGNIVLSGHISSPAEGAVFSRLPEVKVGDGLVLTNGQGTVLFRVRDRQIVQPTAVEFLAPTPAPIVTLVTCYPDRIYSQRLIVRAEPV